jgi:transketolase
MLDIGSHEGPAYIRFTGGMNDEVVYSDDFDFSIGKANRVCSGDDIAILATGNMVRVAMGISEELLKRNICCSVYDFHSIKPLDDAVIKEALNYKMIATIEEHSIIGGFGSSVLEVVNDKYLYNGRIRRYGIADAYPHAASHEAILKKCGLTVDVLADSIESEYKRI